MKILWMYLKDLLKNSRDIYGVLLNFFTVTVLLISFFYPKIDPIIEKHGNIISLGLIFLTIMRASFKSWENAGGATQNQFIVKCINSTFSFESVDSTGMIKDKSRIIVNLSFNNRTNEPIIVNKLIKHKTNLPAQIYDKQIDSITDPMTRELQFLRKIPQNDSLLLKAYIYIPVTAENVGILKQNLDKLSDYNLILTFECVSNSGNQFESSVTIKGNFEDAKSQLFKQWQILHCKELA